MPDISALRNRRSTARRPALGDPDGGVLLPPEEPQRDAQDAPSASVPTDPQEGAVGGGVLLTPEGDEPGTFTEDALDIAPEVNARISRIIRDGIAYAHRHQGSVQGETMLDDTIYQMRLMGLSTREIAQRLNGTITEEDVARRIGMMLARMDELSPAEYRQLQMGRLDALINFCWTLAKGGSADHIELILKTIERMNKMLDLESDKTKIEIELVTSHQATLLMSLVGGVLQVILGDQRVLNILSREEINSMAARALDEAEHVIVDAQSQVLVPVSASSGSGVNRTAKMVLTQRS